MLRYSGADAEMINLLLPEQPVGVITIIATEFVFFLLLRATTTNRSAAIPYRFIRSNCNRSQLPYYWKLKLENSLFSPRFRSHPMQHRNIMLTAIDGNITKHTQRQRARRSTHSHSHAHINIVYIYTDTHPQAVSC